MEPLEISMIVISFLDCAFMCVVWCELLSSLRFVLCMVVKGRPKANPHPLPLHPAVFIQLDNVLRSGWSVDSVGDTQTCDNCPMVVVYNCNFSMKTAHF